MTRIARKIISEHESHELHESVYVTQKAQITQKSLQMYTIQRC